MTVALTPPTLAQIREAQARLRGVALRTPMIRVDDDGRELWLKLECLQPIGSFKIRGAQNALASAEPEELRNGVVTASAGNMGQGVAWCARALEVACHVVVPDHAPAAKLTALDRLGAVVTKVPFDRWWRTLEERRFPGLDGYFVHPVSASTVIAGNATVGLEILEDLPDAGTILVPVGGGGLICGVASAVRAVGSRAQVCGVEPETAAPLAASLRAAEPSAIDYHPSFVDGAGGRAVLPEMWPMLRALGGGSVTVTLAEVAATIQFLAVHARVVAEGAGALAVAAARGEPTGAPGIVCIVSGGNIDAAVLAAVLQGRVP